MITGKDFYTVMTAVVPLYVAMILAYGSVRWWRIFTSDQCSGINRFVAIFAVPLLSFHFIAANNPYTMNLRFIAADTLQKIIMLAALAGWANISRRGNLDWSITIFSLSTLPNTLVMGIPLLIAMYGNAVDSGSLMVQIVVLQCIIWYTLLLFLFEYRAAKILITDQFPDTAASIVSFKVESDVVSLDGGEFLETDAELGRDGKLHVTVRKSTSSRRSISGGGGGGCGYSVSGMTPRPSNLTGAEIYSLSSSRNPTPRGSNFNGTDFFAMMAAPGGAPPRYSNVGQAELYSLQTSRGPTPRPSSFEEPPPAPASAAATAGSPGFGFYSVAGAPYPAPNPDVAAGGGKSGKAAPGKAGGGNHDAKELRMFVWSSSASPVSDAGGLHIFGGNDQSGRSDGVKEIGVLVADHPDGDAVAAAAALHHHPKGTKIEPFPHPTTSPTSKAPSFPAETYKSGDEISPPPAKLGGTAGLVCRKQMPPASVMTRLILIMVWRKLIRNPNTYSSLIGLIWALVSYRWHVSMPKIIAQSISILSDAGLGMAMFSLGLFMALQPKIIACGNSVATFAMAIRFLTGPAVMAAASVAVGLRGVLLHVAIVQAALPQGIVPFVFAKEYNVHPAILSTGVIFGMLIALPITLVYYILLDL